MILFSCPSKEKKIHLGRLEEDVLIKNQGQVNEIAHIRHGTGRAATTNIFRGGGRIQELSNL